MTLMQHYVRAAVTMTCTTLSLFVLSASPAFASYRAWYAPGDDIGQFETGDVSEDETKLIPPVGACGFRMISPNSFRWVSSDGNTVVDDDGLYESGPIVLDAIIWLGHPGCSQPFSTVIDSGDTLELPEAGALYLEIDGAEGAYWVGDDGCHVTGCGGVDGPDDEAIAPPKYWLVSVVSAFKAVSASIVDPSRQPQAFTAVATLAQDVVELQPRLRNLIADRRRSPLGVLEASVRSLEDAATKALTAARSSVATCETRTRQRAYSDAFVACMTAGRYVEHSTALIRTATSLSLQPASR